ncbi:MAG: anthranilate synthase component I family protein [Polyangiaceae bacterium]|nr:anthranilate synthase component I family protein [Polyangiaceae bacterium]
MLVGRHLPLAPDPLAIAARLRESGADRIALLHASDRTPGAYTRYSFIACDPDRESRALDPLIDDPDLTRVFATGAFRSIPRWIGVLPYDAFRHLERPDWVRQETRPPPLLDRPLWLRYPAVVVVDHTEGRVFAVGTTREHVGNLLSRMGTAPLESGFATLKRKPIRVEVTESEPSTLHIDRIRAAKELIARGDLYQVNLARRLRVTLVQGGPLDMYARMSAAAPSPFGACLQLDRDLAVVSTSPELLLRAETMASTDRLISSTNSSMNPMHFARLYTCPIKGTRPRGAGAFEDRNLIRELDEDPKENAELTMIIDVERNDLGRVARAGSVRVVRGPEVVTHRTVHHREALLTAYTKKSASRRDVLEAMLPSGSVTGAPKVRAMEVIANLEAHRRGLYTGGFGALAHDGSMTLAMAIRTVVLQNTDGEYFTGGGIVADSDPQRELEETRWKAIQLEKVARS